MTVPTIPPGIKIAAQASPEPTEEDSASSSRWASSTSSCGPGDKASYEYYASRKRALRSRRASQVYGFGNCERPQPGRHRAGPARPRRQDRGIQDAPAQPGQGRHPLHHLRPHGQRHLEHRARRPPAAAPRRAPSTWPRREKGHWVGASYHVPADPRPRLHRGGDLGQLRLLHPAGRAGGRGGRRAHRHPPRRPARARAGRRAALHLQQLRGLQARAGDRRQPQRGHVPVRRLLAGGRRADGQGRRSRRSATSAAPGKLFKVHFRNVDQPLPHFVETFLDDGYMDMYKVMQGAARGRFRRRAHRRPHPHDGRTTAASARPSPSAT